MTALRFRLADVPERKTVAVARSWAYSLISMPCTCVFPNRSGGPLHPRFLHSKFKGLLKRAGLPEIRFHDLRHTCATLLFSKGSHPKIV